MFTISILPAFSVIPSITLPEYIFLPIFVLVVLVFISSSSSSESERLSRRPSNTHSPRPLHAIPGPRIAAHSNIWTLFQSLLFRKCKAVRVLFDKYGKIVRVGKRTVYFVDKDAMRLVYGVGSGGGGGGGGNGRGKGIGTPLRLDKSAWYKCLVTGNNDHAMTTLDHARWNVVRKSYAAHYSATNIAGYQYVFGESVKKCVKFLKEKKGTTVDTLVLFRRMMIDMDAGFLFGRSLNVFGDGGYDAKALEMAVGDFPLRGFLRSVVPTFVWPWLPILATPFPRFKLLLDSDRILAEFVMKRLEETRDETDHPREDVLPPPLLKLLLSNQRAAIAEGAGEEARMSDADIVSEAFAHLIASADTVATALSFAFYELTRLPDVLEKLRAEVDAHMPNKDRFPELQVLNRMEYLGVFVKEVLRVYGAAAGALERVVGEDGLDICGYHLPEGTVVGTIPYCAHRLPEVFLRPDEFRPERWGRHLSEVPIPLSEREDLTEMNAHFVPFGIGPRVCGGQSMAMAVLKMAVVAVVRHFEVEWRGKEGDMDVIDSFVILPAGLKCELGFVERE